MENIAHSLCGAAIAESGFSERLGRKTAWWVGLISANVPDIDLVTYPILGREHYMFWHRGLTHSLLACLLVPPLIAWLAQRWSKGARFRDLWLLAFLGYASHLLMDVPTSWGTMLLAPFDYTRFAMHWVYIVDLFFWIILSAPFWMGRFIPVKRAVLARYSMLVLAAYIGFCGVLHGLAVGQVQETAEQHGVGLVGAAAYPSPFLPVYWNGVGDDGEFLHQGAIQVLGGSGAVLDRVFARNLDHPAVETVRKTTSGRLFLEEWATDPFATIRCLDDGSELWVSLSDLRYVNPWLNRTGFSLEFRLSRGEGNAEYQVEEHFWKTTWEESVLPDTSCDWLPRARPSGAASSRDVNSPTLGPQ
jgi:membrane-bound metal-dependent hydrolase YbcI (DUF457 family)